MRRCGVPPSVLSTAPDPSFRKVLESGGDLYALGTVAECERLSASVIADWVQAHGYQAGTFWNVDGKCWHGSADRLFSKVKAAYDKNGKSEDEVVEQFSTYGLLSVSRLGIVPCTQWAAGILYRVLAERRGRMRPTIVATPYEPSTLVQRLGGWETSKQLVGEYATGALMVRTEGYA